VVGGPAGEETALLSAEEEGVEEVRAEGGLRVEAELVPAEEEEEEGVVEEEAHVEGEDAEVEDAAEDVEEAAKMELHG